MAVTTEQLASYVGGASPADAAFVVSTLQEANALVTAFVGAATVPAAVVDRAVLETGSELFHRRNAPNGLAQFAALGEAPVRIARDPMLGAYPLLRPFVAGLA